MKRRDFIKKASAIGKVTTGTLLTESPVIASVNIECNLPTTRDYADLMLGAMYRQRTS